MTDFNVDTDELAQAAVSMGHSLDPQCRQVAAAPPGEATVGQADLTAALGSFAAAWGRGSDALASDTRYAADGLRANTLRYAEVDATQAQAFRSIAARLQ